MIEIGIDGGRTKQREVVEECVYWCIKKLLPNIRKLSIDIEIKSLDGYHGFCYMGDDRKHYIIELQKNQNLYDLITTVCHEMVHVRQFHNGQLSEKGNDWVWRESYSSTPVLSRDTEKPHTELPHEIEAYDLDTKLALEFFPNMKTVI